MLVHSVSDCHCLFSWQHIPVEDTLEALKIVFFFQLAQAALDKGNALG